MVLSNYDKIKTRNTKSLIMRRKYGKKAFITGTNRGIGYETKKIIRNWYKVIIGSRDLEKKAVNELSSNGFGRFVSMMHLIKLHRKKFMNLSDKYKKLDILITSHRSFNRKFVVTNCSLYDKDIKDTFQTNFFHFLTQKLL